MSKNIATIRHFGCPPHEIIVDGKNIKVYYTPGIIAIWRVRKEFTDFLVNSVIRHCNEDWGELCEEDVQVNDLDPDSAMSAYTFQDEVKIWVKSEDGHIIVLLPSEY